MDASSTEYMESATVRFEWTLRGLKNLFDSSKGEAKSKVVKSIKFGGGRWQVLFYANSGSPNSEGQTFISLYLSCEPTTEERDHAVNGKWVREGLFKFGFELRNLQKTVLFNNKEANDHSFSCGTQNWGWAQFSRRDSVYYQAPMVKQQDAFLIICTITSNPAVAVPPPLIAHRYVPKSLLDAMGSLLDDPLYSDVEFILPRRGTSSTEPRRIYAARRLLQRVEYFDTMFGSGFAEGSSNAISMAMERGGSLSSVLPDQTQITNALDQFEDSDDEDDYDDMVIDTDSDVTREHSSDTMRTEGSHISVESGPSDTTGSWTSVTEDDGQVLDGTQRNVRAKLSHPSTPRSAELVLAVQEVDMHPPPPTIATVGPQKIQVLIEDAAYTTFRAVLHYVYTDTILFAPLSSSFLSSAAQTPKVTASSSAAPISESQAAVPPTQRAGHQQSESVSSMVVMAPQSRKEWIMQWEKKDTGRPRPCSAKAAYRLADKYDLQELKQRAFQHIVKSLTVENVAYEVFSTFSAAFEDIRKVEVRFFLDHWGEIRRSDSMRNVWQQIRLGRHPGFEEVWPTIALNLEFKPRPPDSSGGDGNTGES